METMSDGDSPLRVLAQLTVWREVWRRVLLAVVGVRIASSNYIGEIPLCAEKSGTPKDKRFGIAFRITTQKEYLPILPIDLNYNTVLLPLECTQGSLHVVVDEWRHLT
jgi:hypothetical protein